MRFNKHNHYIIMLRNYYITVFILLIGVIFFSSGCGYSYYQYKMSPPSEMYNDVEYSYSILLAKDSSQSTNTKPFFESYLNEDKDTLLLFGICQKIKSEDPILPYHVLYDSVRVKMGEEDNYILLSKLIDTLIYDEYHLWGIYWRRSFIYGPFRVSGKIPEYIHVSMSMIILDNETSQVLNQRHIEIDAKRWGKLSILDFLDGD